MTFSYVLRDRGLLSEHTDPTDLELTFQKVNAGICATLAQAIANACPKAFILVISNPVNSTVPVFAETLKKAGVYDPKR